MGKNNNQLTEMEQLRATAGIRSDYVKPKTSKLKTLDIESDILRSFSMVLRDFSRMKNQINGDEYNGMHSGPYNRKPLKMELGDANKKKLYRISMEKIELLKEAVQDCFGEEREEDDD